MLENKNILLCGVGGQGTILASKILSHALLDGGFDVKMSEIHGMSQRGGSVVTQVRYGQKIYSPIIGSGSADILVSFEAMEALRYLVQLRPNGTAVVNNCIIPTATTLAGQQEYPLDVTKRVSALVKTKVLDATALAIEMGNEKCMNIIMLGALVKLMGLDDLDWDGAMACCINPAFLELNKKALVIGMSAVA